jgi:vacuolar-type H+-ATPase subunit I/STV1
MPTGYTAELVEKGMEFNDFVLTCARAFGACIELREDKLAPAPKKISRKDDYYSNALKNAIKELSDFEKMSDEKQLKTENRKRELEIKRCDEMLEKYSETNQRLKEMEQKVERWVPPTDDHKNLKTFMLEQIKMSYEDLGYYRKEKERLQALDPKEMIASTIENLKHNVKYYTKEIESGQDKYENRDKWLEDLYSSLGL